MRHVINFGVHFRFDDDAYVRNNKGALILRNNGQSGDADQSQIYIQATPAENSIQCSPNGAVTLYNTNIQINNTTASIEKRIQNILQNVKTSCRGGPSLQERTIL